MEETWSIKRNRDRVQMARQEQLLMTIKADAP